MRNPTRTKGFRKAIVAFPQSSSDRNCGQWPRSPSTPPQPTMPLNTARPLRWLHDSRIETQRCSSSSSAPCGRSAISHKDARFPPSPIRDDYGAFLLPLPPNGQPCAMLHAALPSRCDELPDDSPRRRFHVAPCRPRNCNRGSFAPLPVQARSSSVSNSISPRTSGWRRETWGKGHIEVSAFYWNFPVRWLSNDGKPFTLVFTGKHSNDSWNTVEGRFIVRLPVRSPRRQVAPSCRDTRSSVH